MNEQQKQREVEIITRLLLSETDGKHPSTDKIWNRYNNFKLNTSKRAAVVLLSTLVEYYRLGFRAYDEKFNLILNTTFKTNWKELFPESKVTCEKIVNDPWSLITISDTFLQQGKNKEKYEYEFYHKIFLESLFRNTTTTCDHRSPFLLANNKYRPPRIVSIQRLSNETERLSKIATSMVFIIEAKGDCQKNGCDFRP